jgi:hypothetical protein
MGDNRIDYKTIGIWVRKAFEVFEVFSTFEVPGGRGKMPKLVQVWHLPKSKTVDACDHALGKTGHSGCTQTNFSIIWELDTIKMNVILVLSNMF